MPPPITGRYRRPGPTDPLDQGDVIGPCPLPQFLVQHEGWNNDLLSDPTYDKAAQELVIVVSQTCDLERTGKERLNSVAVCPVYRVTTLLGNDIYAPDMEATGKPVTKKNLTSLRKGGMVGYHYLPSYHGDPEFPESAVDLLQVYTVPRQLLQYLVEIGRRKLTMNPPYRECLGHDLGRVFSRVGLPPEDFD